MSSDEEQDELMDLEAIRDQMLNQPRGEHMQVSAWEDDNDGIEEERNPREPSKRAFLNAVENGEMDKVQKFVIKDRKLLYCKDKDGYTALHRACYGNHVDIVEYLLKMGAKIDAKTTDEWQPLHSACCWNNVECIAVLISHGAMINAKSKGDQTPLHLVSASSYNSPALQFLLLDPDTDHSIVNASGDTAQDIAKRTDMKHPCDK